MSDTPAVPAGPVNPDDADVPVGSPTPVRTDWNRDALSLLMVPLAGTELTAVEREVLAAGVGSVILFGYNTPDAPTARDLARSVHDLAPDCVIAIDEEGGDVTRLESATGSSLPTAWALGALDDVDLTRRMGHALGAVLAACDIDLDLAPVLDVSTDPANPVIGTRAYGDEPDLVARHARAMASGLRDEGIAVCGKHFPGHGATSVDSHTALPLIDLPEQSFRREHLAPWALSPWMDAVMTAHVLVPALGEGPATIARWSRDLLDEVSLGGFHGLVITDALDMAAVSEDPGYTEAVVRAVEAGADLLCLGTSIRRDSTQMITQAHDALVAAVASGRISAETLAERASRTRLLLRAIRSRRRWLPTPDLQQALEHAQSLGSGAALRAVQVRGARLTLQPTCVIDVRGGGVALSSVRRGRLLTALHERGIDARELAEGEDLEAALRTEQILVTTRLARSDVAEQETLNRILSARPDAIVVHVGVPDAAPRHDRLVLAHGAGRTMMRAAVDALLAGGDR